MSASQFHLVTEWMVAAPQTRVWDLLLDVDAWPSWWHGVGVEVLERGDEGGIGAYRRMTWKTALPYSVTFNMRVTRLERPTLIEGRADGELTGLGRWTLSPNGNGTNVRYDWIVELDKAWMRAFAPVLRPVFTWNHNVVMGWGRANLERKLAAG